MSEVTESKALEYIKSKGWTHRENGDQISVEFCPYCKHSDYKFYMAIGGVKDGLHDCKICCKSDNLYGLMMSQGDRLQGVQSMKDTAGQKYVEDLPDYMSCHRRLLEDLDAMDYLIAKRGYTMQVIERQRLGVIERTGRHGGGKKKWVVMPYLVGDSCVYAKFRTVPPADKDFDSPAGHDAPLYNQQIIKPGIEELIFVEGEADALSLMSQGIDYVLGVPGASLKKSTWVTLIDEAVPKTIYILYDKDKVGQKGAQELASRIGVQKCMSIQLPDFSYENEDGETVKGKDINEWFRYGGGTTELFAVLKAQSKKFDVPGVKSLTDALEDMERELEGKDTLKATYDTPWEALNRKLGGAEPGDVIDILAPAKIGKTTFALNWVDYLVAKYSETGLVFCLEMSQSRLARKWVSYITQTDDSPAQTDEEARKKAVILKAAIPLAKEVIRNREADLLFAYTIPKDVDDALDTIRQAVRRYGVKFVVFDNIQLLCDMTLRNLNHRTIHLSQISKKFKALAIELGLVMIRIVQPKKIQEGHIVGINDVDGSSQIEKDCDAMIVLHRTQRAAIRAADFENIPFMDEDQAFEPQMYTRICLSRYSGGGVTTLMFNGATSTVAEFTPAQHEAAAKPVLGNEIPMEKPRAHSVQSVKGLEEVDI